GEPADASLLSRAVRAGARSLLVRPYEAEELVSVIREVAERSDTRTPATAGGSAVVTAVYSPKGGAGATTVATALAVALSESHAGRVGIVDLDLRFGGVGIALDLRAQNTIVDVLARPGPLDGAIVDDIFVTHGSGVKVLLAPETLGLADAVSPEAIGRLVQALRPHFDHLVLDLPTSFDDVAMAALRVADHVLLVTTPELPALRDLQLVMRIHERVAALIGGRLETAAPEAIRLLLAEHVPAALDEERLLLSRADRIRLQEAVYAETAGYGPIDDLLRDESVTEIMVNG